MTFTPGTWTCDRCGEPVSVREMFTLGGGTGRAAAEYSGWIAHYHLDCWGAGIYDDVKAIVESYRDGTAAPAEQPAAPSRRAIWKAMPSHARDRTVIEAVGDQPLTASQIPEALNAERTEDERLYPSNVRGTIEQLITAGELVRVMEQWRGKPRWRYSRNTQLDGPIADLEQLINADIEEA